MKHAKVVVVEDDLFLIQACKVSLEKAGLEVIEVRDGGNAIATIKRVKPGVVVLDVGLPHMNGFEILETLKGEKTTKSIPVFMMTRLGAEADRERALALGADLYFNKSEVMFAEVTEAILKQLHVKH